MVSTARIARWYRSTIGKLSALTFWSSSTPDSAVCSDANVGDYPSRVVVQYGEPLRTYRGRGTLTATPYKGSATGQPQEFACTFVAAQLLSGKILVACSMDPTPSGMSMYMTARSFSGTTTDGWQLQAQDMTQTDALEAEAIAGGRGIWMAFEANVLDARAADERQEPQVAEWRYGITNYLFDGSYGSFAGRQLERAITLRLPASATGGTGIVAAIVQRPAYRTIAPRLRTLKGTVVTAEVLVPASNEADQGALDDTVEALAYVLSVGAGCKVQRVYRDGYDESGRLVESRHEARIIRPYSSQAIIPARAGHVFVNRRYIERGVASYMKWRKALPLNHVIDAYLDAKAEGDFLEARGAKLAIALEALKHEFAKRKDARVPGERLEKKQFERLQTHLWECAHRWFEDERLPALLADDMVPKGSFRDLNRPSFRDLVTSLTEEIDLATTDDQIRQFVESRNKLVHQGQFACVANAQAGGRPRPPSSELIAEYFADVDLLDRIVLRLLHYDGEYLRRTLEGRESAHIARRSQT